MKRGTITPLAGGAFSVATPHGMKVKQWVNNGSFVSVSFEPTRWLKKERDKRWAWLRRWTG